MRTSLGLLASSCLAILLARSAEPQAVPTGAGRFTNLETSQTHPLEIATIGGIDHVLVCNTPDDAVEIYEAHASSPYVTFRSSIRVGLGPTSVRYISGRFYACNFDGDSVSVVRLTGGAASVTNPIIERTVRVGNEPGDIAFSGNVAVVSLSTRSRIAGFTFPGMTPLNPAEILLEADSGDAFPYAIKTPRQLAWVGNRVYAANLRGGSPDPGLTTPQYDAAIFQYDFPSDTGAFIGGLGTTNHAFAINTEGTRMFVVGLKARNHDAFGLDNVAALPTGFVQSWLWTVDIAANGVMTPRPEAQPNQNSDFESINLNRDYTQTTLTPVASANALVQPTGIVLVQSGSTVQMIAITAFSSDKVAFLTPSLTTPGGYQFQRVAIPTQGSGSYSQAGPRGIVRSAATGFFYTNGRLDNSLHVIDPSANTPIKTSIALHNDPTPTVIREGRKFLYSAEFSGGRMAACCVCHIDANTDSLAWDLGETVAGPDIEPEFHDGDMDVDQVPTIHQPPPVGSGEGHYPAFPGSKGRMVTQSLQGLINFPLNEEMQFASTNAPYYWRGVRRGPNDASDPFKELTEAFDTFNEGFVKLQGMADIDPGAGVRGISVEDMRKYRLFINTIFYPPNPEQPPDRVVPGTLPADPNDVPPLISQGYGGSKQGLAAFFNTPQVTTNGPLTNFTTTCNDCHALPSGSSRTATLLFAAIDGLSLLPTVDHPFESAALRNLAPREMSLHATFADVETHIVANTALLHPGTPQFIIDSDAVLPLPAGVARATSINTFLFDFFPIAGFGMPLVKFVREFDTGIAPAVGRAYTVGTNSTANDAEFELLETQVEHGNIGLAVYERKSGIKLGYWYDPGAGKYVQEGTGTTKTRSDLFTNATSSGNVVIAQATPLGADRRWASSSGVATVLMGPTPSAPDLRGMVPNTAWVDVRKFRRGLHLGTTVDPRDTADINVLLSTDPLILGTTAWALRKLQSSVGGLFGVPVLARHEPPRRFRIIGKSIRPGARLILQSTYGDEMEMDLYPVLVADGPDEDSLPDVVWETFQEMEALHVFALLNGGFRDPGVAATLLRSTSTPVLAPLTNNLYKVQVINEDGTAGEVSGEVLTIHDDRDTVD